MTAIYTTVGGFSLLVVKALDSQGFNGEATLSDCGIDTRSLTDPDSRIPVDQIGELFRVAVSITGDQAFGLKVGTFVCPTTFHALSMSMWLANSLKQAFERLVRYGPLISDAGVSGFEERDDEYRYWTDLAGTDADFVNLLEPAALDALYSAIITFCRSVTDVKFAPRYVSLIRREPDDVNPYLKFFGCPVNFDEPRMSLCFDHESLVKPLPSGHPELLSHSDHVIVQSLNRFGKQDIVSRLRVHLLQQLPNGRPTQSQMASELHCSLRSLQRKLNERGLTYETVLNEVRREEGLKYIAQSHLPIGDISYLLGFRSPTNFSRTFKSWTGMSPRDYRRHTAEQHQK